ncbi:hypothetical protein D8B22_11705 [Verminephrobacter aporrectodeae subsp. tuberculatae]|nr:hypothetical protein [Verminephrobacter aporrectodeae subsp. tuberculatae]
MLLASSPEMVLAFLERRAVERRNDEDEVDEETEVALRGRNNLLVNLALAKHGKFMATVLPMFEACEPSGAIRLATLANTMLGDRIFSDFPTDLFGGPEQMAAWMDTAPDDELSALFENPNLSNSFLTDLLKGSRSWDVPDEKMLTIVTILANNERMRAAYAGDSMDGFAEYLHGAVFNAAWKLAERVPTTERWALALRCLYNDCMQMEAFSIEKPLDLVARWHSDPADAELMAWESEGLAGGWLSHYQGVRKGLARLALAKDYKLLAELLASEDLALRCAAYSDGDLSPSQLSAAYDKDGEFAFDGAVRNHKLWRTAPRRDALEEVAWAMADNDKHKHSDLPPATFIFNRIKEDHQKNHPAWFKDEEDSEDDPGDKPATKADVQALAERMATPESDQGMEQFKQTLATLSNHVGWVWWFSLGALIASLRHW